MANDAQNQGTPEDGNTSAAGFIEVIDAYEKEFEKWEKRADKIIKRYRDERDIDPALSDRFNILWSNTQTALPLLYSQTPKVVVERRKDKFAPVARVACAILEDTTRTNMDGVFEDVLRQVVLDYELTARGTGWVAYQPEFSKNTISPQPVPVKEMGGVYLDDKMAQYPKEKVSIGPDGLMYGMGEAFHPLEYERVIPMYVHYKDFGHNVCRYWAEVWVVWRKCFFSKAEAVKMLGQEVADKLPYDTKYMGTEQKTTAKMGKKAVVYEMWDSTDKTVKYVCKGLPDSILKTVDDPLKLEKFFPCPKPLFGTMTNEQLVPIPTYTQYQDQANELDDITARIGRLVKALKVVGIYAGDKKSTIMKMLDADSENKMIPVEDWASMQGSGGITKVIEWLPMDMVAKALISLYDARDKTKQTIYEITGFSDIMRGASNASETATAQQIKGKFGTLRVNDRQKQVAMFARDLIELMGQTIANVFDPQTLRIASGVMPTDPAAVPAQPPQGAMPMPPAGGMPGQPPMPPQPGMPPMGAPALPAPTGDPDAQYFDQAVALLKNQVLRHFTIDIEADSTIMPDLEEEKKARTEFLTAVGGFLENAVPLANQNPDIAPLLGEMLLFGVRGFRTGRSLEGYVENYVQKLEQAAQQPAPPKPDPELLKMQAEQKLAEQQSQFDMKMEQQKAQNDFALEQQKAASALAIEKQKAQSKAELDAFVAKLKLDNEMALETMKVQRGVYDRPAPGLETPPADQV